MLEKLLKEWKENKEETAKLGFGEEYIVLQKDEYFLLYDLKERRICYKYSSGGRK